MKVGTFPATVEFHTKLSWALEFRQDVRAHKVEQKLIYMAKEKFANTEARCINKPLNNQVLSWARRAVSKLTITAAFSKTFMNDSYSKDMANKICMLVKPLYS
jgi:hypothetical protein